MNTNQIKKFAAQARTVLLKGVSNKLKAFFDEKGNPHVVPQPIQGGCVFGEQLRDEKFYRAWQSLNKHIAIYGFKGTVEEVAYTWFNRLVAINILTKNGFAEPVLQFTNPVVHVPHIVELARSGQVPDMSVNARRALNELLNDDSKIFEQFAFLIDCYCSANPIISKCFGKVDDYSFLLLPNNILAEGSLVDMLNSSDIISDEDYLSPELIGWLYQFYISERKDEVFAKKGKFESDEIPAATQIFTPNWIVKYMVQNSLGRIYLDSESYSGIAEKMQYLVESEPSADKFAWSDVKELTCADLACGSGHILNECFDLLYDIYIEQGYSRRSAVESIFAHNLVGIDIDTRAKQMATFALLLKACRRDASFADAHAMPRVYDMPDPYPHKQNLREILPHFFLGGSPKMIEETIEAIGLFDDARSLGSIMKFNISPSTREAIVRRLAEYREAGHTDFDSLFCYLDIILALTDKYAAIVMNPPYMGRAGMNENITKYVQENYAKGKWDLFATFMLVARDILHPCGKMSMINMHSWMFLDAFDDLRAYFVENCQIDNMLHLGPNTFDELSGEVVQNTAFTMSNSAPSCNGTYYRLISGVNCTQKEKLFLNQRNCFKNVNQHDFVKIPGIPIAYWLSNKWFNLFDGCSIGDVSVSKAGVVSGDDNFFVKCWHEVSVKDILFKRARKYGKYHTFQKGGTNRRSYGNNDFVFRLKDFWDEEFYNKSMRRGDENSYFKLGIGWSYTGSTKNKAFRQIENCVCGTGTPTLYVENDCDFYYLLGYLNSNITAFLLPILNPTLSLAPGYVIKLPYVDTQDKGLINEFSKSNVEISKQDWDAHETSWDFQENELVAFTKDKAYYSSATIEGELAMEWITLENVVNYYKSKWEKMFRQLHANEEELNRQFIEIYGLQDELTPDVPLEEITILQQGEISIDKGQIKWHDDVIVKQLTSYAIGVWMGRYRLDKPGLHIAHPELTAEEVCSYEYSGNNVEIDDDGIIPVLSSDSSFADNACHRLRDFLRIVFGADTLIENINFIQNALGKDIEAYFLKDFWKDHKKMYQNRPIYWLFSSKKGAFQCLVYMHRMDAYTAERVRSKYLLPHMESLGVRIAELRAEEAMLSTAKRRTLDRLVKELEECREYHDRLHLVADQQIAFDLDEGVVVNYAKFGDVLAKIK